MKKVIMILDNDFRSDNRVEKEATSMISNGYNVELICVKSDLPTNDFRKGIKITRILHPEISTKPFSRDSRKSAAKVVQYILNDPPDFLHCHDYNVIHIGSTVKKENSDIKLIYDSHEYFAGFSFYRRSKDPWLKIKTFLVWKLLLRREKKSCKELDGLISTTDFLVNLLQRRFLVKNFVSLRNIPEKTALIKSDYIRETLLLPPSALILVHSGNIYFPISYLNNIYSALSNASKDVRLVFLVSNERCHELKKEVSNLNFNDRIYFIDYPNKDNIISILSSADIGFCWIDLQFKSHILTSVNRYWEYVHAQLPVLSNPQIEIEEQIDQNKNGIIYYDLEKDLNNLLENLTIYKSNAVKASSLISWEIESVKLIELYRKIS